MLNHPENNDWRKIYSSFLDDLDLEGFQDFPNPKEDPDKKPYVWIKPVPEEVSLYVDIYKENGMDMKIEDLLLAHITEPEFRRLLKSFNTAIETTPFYKTVNNRPRVTRDFRIAACNIIEYVSPAGLVTAPFGLALGISENQTIRDYTRYMSRVIKKINTHILTPKFPQLPPYPI